MKLLKKESFIDRTKDFYFCGIKIPRFFHKYKNTKICGKNNKIILIKKGKEYEYKNDIKGLQIKIKGDNNTIKLHYPIKALSSCIDIQNDNCFIEIGPSENLSFLIIECNCGDGQICKIGAKTTTYGLNIKLCEQSSCIIGEDCMFASSVRIWASDCHSILDKNTNEILNSAKSVIIGNHVWVCEGVKITKKTKIHDNCIIGISSVCVKDYKEKNVCIAGNPAKIVKRNINWNRENPYILQKYRKSLLKKLKKHVDKKQSDIKINKSIETLF